MTQDEMIDMPPDELADEPADEREVAERPLIDDLRAAQDPTLDAIQSYLQEIGRVPLLSAAEEVELAERMARGRAAAGRLESGEDLAPQLRAALRADVERGEAARSHL